MSVATLTSKHQLTLPRDVRERMVLKKGDRIQFLPEADGTFRLAKKASGHRSDGAARSRLKGSMPRLDSAAIRRLAGEGARASVVRRSGR